MTALQAQRLSAPGRLAPLSLALEAGTLTMLVGPNGAGKTSLLHAIAAIGDTAGDIRVNGIDLARLGPAARSHRLHFAPASRELRWPLVARDLVRLGLEDRPTDRLEAALAQVSALAFAARRADRLSTGERARLMLARALLARADVVLMDEPIANLDPLWQLRTLGLLRGEAARGAAVLVSLHDLNLAAAHADRVLLIDGGRIAADGPPADALAPDRLARVFGVRRTAAGWEAVR